MAFPFPGLGGYRQGGKTDEGMGLIPAGCYYHVFKASEEKKCGAGSDGGSFT